MSDATDPPRDERLGDALRALPAPAHGPAFRSELRARLEQEAGRQGPARSSRRPRRLRVPPRPLLAGAALAIAVLIALATLTTDRPGHLGVESASAAEVVKRVREALGATHSLSGVLIVTERNAPGAPLRTTRLRFALTARGDVRIIGDPGLGDSYYDAATARMVLLRLPGATSIAVERGLAPGPPDTGPVERPLQLQLATVARALSAAQDGAVREATAGGRAVWILRTPVSPNRLGFSSDRATIVVDRATGFPVSILETLHGRLVRRQQLTRLRVDPALGPRAFRPRLDPGVSPIEIDGGFQPASPARAAAVTGYRPLVPGRLPAGLRRAETRVARAAQATGAEGLNPPSRNVISTAYRRGLDRVLVTTRAVGADPGAWSDPLAAGEGFPVHEQRVRLRSGAFAGRLAHVVIDPRAVPHIWVLGANLVGTVSGPLSRDQLIAAAESLAPA